MKKILSTMGQIDASVLIGFALSIAVATVGSIVTSVRITEGKIDSVNENASDALQRITRVETESVQYKEDIKSINAKLDMILREVK
jgi:hypothetical protein